MSKDFFSQYKSPRWQQKRLEALQASEFVCQCCGDSETTLHVHHKRYIKGRKVWEYSLDELEVLCEDCHEAAHRNTEEFRRVVGEFSSEGIQALGFVVKGFGLNTYGSDGLTGSFDEALDSADEQDQTSLLLGAIAGALSRVAVNDKRALLKEVLRQVVDGAHGSDPFVLSVTAERSCVHSFLMSGED